jgi:gliding motility-associated-like protein
MNRLLTLIFIIFPAGLSAQYAIEADVITGCMPLTVNFSIVAENGSDTVTAANWDFGTDLILPSSELSPEISFDSLGIYIVSCQVSTGTDIIDLSDRDTIVVFNCNDSLLIPNVFTPNDDNLNDRFYIDTDGTSVYTFKVFTRSGTRVFESESPTVSWDGRSLSGQKMKPGIYYYTIRRNDDVHLKEVKGFVYLYE